MNQTDKINQINQTDQINEIDQTDEMNQSSFRAFPARLALLARLPINQTNQIDEIDQRISPVALFSLDITTAWVRLTLRIVRVRSACYTVCHEQQTSDEQKSGTIIVC